MRVQRLLLFLSRIHPKNGVVHFNEAFAAEAAINPPLHLVIAGPDQPACQQWATELGIADRITWPGMFSGELNWGAFRSAELLCLPSHPENFGVVVTQALACGLPVAMDEPVNNSAEVAAAGVGLVNEATVVCTTEVLRQWLAQRAEEKHQIGLREAQLFLERFDFASVSRNLLPVLESVLMNDLVFLVP